MNHYPYAIMRNMEQYLGRYEFVDGKSAKFWECLRDGDNPGQYATRWGAIKLTKTRHNTKGDMSALDAATKIAEKLNKGYKLVGLSGDVMAARFADEDNAALRKNTVLVASEHPVEAQAVEEAAAPARRRL